MLDDNSWFEILKIDQGHRYKVVIDNDCIAVVDKENSKDEYHFKEFGEEFILELLKNIGCDANLC